MSKKSVVAQGSIGPFSSGSDQGQVPGVLKKESYLKYTPEDFQKKLQEFAFQQQKEEEKINLQKAPLIRMSTGSVNPSESEFGGGDFIETQVESSRASCVKLSTILETSIYLQIEPLCQQCDKPLKEEEILSGF